MSDPVRTIYRGLFVAKEKLAEAEARIKELEVAIREHRENVWGDIGFVGHDEDERLYKALLGGGDEA